MLIDTAGMFDTIGPSRAPELTDWLKWHYDTRQADFERRSRLFQQEFDDVMARTGKPDSADLHAALDRFIEARGELLRRLATL